MNDELLKTIEREVLSWPGMDKEPREDDVASYRFGRRHVGHIHEDGVADIVFPKDLHDQLIADGQAEPHRGGFRSVVSFSIRDAADAPRAIELFRMAYALAKESAERRASASAGVAE